MLARWIRLGPIEPHDFRALCLGVAESQAREAPPLLLWGLGEDQYLFALLAPLRLAPGRATRWISWGLAPAIATYRQFGVPAYLQDEAIWLNGRRIASGSAATAGDFVVVSSSFLLRFPAACLDTPSGALEEAFRQRLEAQHGWQFEHSWLGAKPLVDRPDLAADRA